MYKRQDVTITMASEAGQLELNVMEPVIAFCLFSGLDRLARGVRALQERCVKGMSANAERCRGMVQNSVGIVTALMPSLGYECTAALAREALESEKSVYDLVLEKKLLSRERLDELLAPANMLRPGRAAPSS